MNYVNKNIIQAIDSILIDKSKVSLKDLSENIKELKSNYLNKKKYFYVLSGFKSDQNFINKTKILANGFGKVVLQNRKKQKYVHVTPNINSIKSLNRLQKNKYLRYHETNAGGDLHSDGPQLNTPPRYVFLACIRNSAQGGDNIIVDCNKIYSDLKKKEKNVFDILNSNYLIERRGFNYSNHNIFSKPIFSYKDNELSFRYLRTYIEEAYKIKKSTLPDYKKNALDVLDTYLSKKKYQSRFKLNPGEILIINNSLLAHGRTSFTINNNSAQRDYLRIWIK